MRFQYLEPKTLKQASALLDKYGENSRVMAGGTDLMVKMKNRSLKPGYVIDLERIPRLDYIKYFPKKGVAIGSLTKISTVEYSPVIRDHYPVLAYAAGQVGSIAIRNLATIGGNLCNAAPSADTAPALICLGANLRVTGPKGKREVPLENFFLGPGRTILGKGEILVEITLPPPQTGTRAIYFKHSPRGAMDLGVVGVAAAAVMEGNTIKDIRIALGAVASTPLRAQEAEKTVTGRRLTEDLISKCAAAAAGESCCISDIRGSAEYRREMVEVFTRRALRSFIV
jgi:CO/xanthine dehydrogenase FAD-binding subunit